MLRHLRCLLRHIPKKKEQEARKQEPRHQISIALMTKDDNPYLKEWLDYHQMVGVDHFYIYDNNSNDELETVLHSYIEAGIVERIHWPTLICYGQTQLEIYENCLKKHRNDTKWMAFIDSDEFIVPMKYWTLKETLEKEYANKPLIFANWKMFGTSHIHLSSPCPMLPYLVKCSKREFTSNKIGKMIVNPLFLPNKVGNAHITTGHVQFVDGSGNPYPYTTPEQMMAGLDDDEVHDDFLRINHYTHRDEWFFHNVKIPRVIYRNKPPGREYDMSANHYNVEEDYRILEIINALTADDALREPESSRFL